MIDISALLQEAKPLYLARKKRRRRLKAAGVLCVCLAAVQFGIAAKNMSAVPADEMTALYVSLYEPVNWENENISGVLNRNSVFPVDEYGLVAVI